jgi:predicted RNA-binding Zn ribbon-like protein
VAGYPRDWLSHRDDEPASDLDLVVLLINSLDLLEDPPDRLTDLTWFRTVVRELGRDDIAGSLRPRDLTGLRELRESLRSVFQATSADQAARLLNSMLLKVSAVPELVVSTSGIQLQVAPGKRGLAALRARLPAALAAQVADRGLGRLGTCAARPCQCAFVDRTRAETRRFCCAACNDRAAAQLYRQRRRKA